MVLGVEELEELQRLAKEAADYDRAAHAIGYYCSPTQRHLYPYEMLIAHDIRFRHMGAHYAAAVTHAYYSDLHAVARATNEEVEERVRIWRGMGQLT